MIQYCSNIPEKLSSEISSNFFIYWGFDQHGCVRKEFKALKYVCSGILCASCKFSDTWHECLSIDLGNQV